MRIILLLFITGFSLFSVELSGQFNDNFNAPAGPALNATIYRDGYTGIGFLNPYGGLTGLGTALGGIPRARFSVRDGILAHYGDAGSIGDFNNSTWSGLGFGGPATGASPYGLAMARDNFVGFYNLFPGATGGQDVVAGFGSTTTNANRFRIRNYDNAATFGQGKDILIANPRGAVGINADPFAAFSVDTRVAAGGGILGGGPPIVAAIAIQGEQPFLPGGVLTSASAIGNQANASLVLSGVVVEGSRAQIPSFVPNVPPQLPNNPPTLGVAVNLQAVIDPSGGPNSFSPTVVNANVQQREYAELSWQDLDYQGNTTTECANAEFIERANKFYISFRNGRTGTVPGGGAIGPFGNSFSPLNKRPVMTFTANGRVGINTVNPICENNGKLVFLDVNGWINSPNGLLIGSDRRFKKDIEPVKDALEKIRQLQATTYYMRKDEFPEKSFDEGRHYGFIAQDLEKVIPEATGVNTDGYYAVNYTMLIPVLTEAIKEQDQIITQQEEDIAALRTEIAELRSQFNDFKSGQEAGSLQGFRLEQNVPNPFSESTVITYQVPGGTVGAKISVYDLTGRTVKTWTITENQGQINVNAGELTSGLYIYDLQVGGRQILERKMTVAAKN